MNGKGVTRASHREKEKERERKREQESKSDDTSNIVTEAWVRRRVNTLIDIFFFLNARTFSLKY
jgi:hypothetical protein